MTYVDYEDDNVDVPEDEEWREGECDHCYGEPVEGPLGTIYCACEIGRGASEELCRCGPPTEDPEGAAL
ncbi:MAG: hypothetical protein ACRDVE_18080 [Actinocrinis sp.]